MQFKTWPSRVVEELFNTPKRVPDLPLLILENEHAPWAFAAMQSGQFEGEWMAVRAGNTNTRWKSSALSPL
jgi:hypothetical protein